MALESELFFGKNLFIHYFLKVKLLAINNIHEFIMRNGRKYFAEGESLPVHDLLGYFLTGEHVIL